MQTEKKEPSLEERRNQISVLAHHVEERVIRYHYSLEKLMEKKDQFSEIAIQINSIEEELNFVKQNFKERLDPLKSASKELLGAIIRKYDDMPRKVFAVPNFDDSVMEFFNDEGTMVDSRKLYPDEKQLRIS